jgi:hypothetical protein
MTRTVIARFNDGEAARRAAVALGRTELAAGPTRVQVGATGPAPAAQLELRVEDGDAPRAIALLREHGARIADRGDDGPDLRSGDSPLAGWGMAVADAVTAAMAGASASDAQVPAGPRRAASDDDGRAAATSSIPSSTPSSTPSSAAAPARDAAGTPPPDAPPSGGPTVWGNAPSRSQAGSGSGSHLSDTVDAGTGTNMGQIGPGTSLRAAMGATDGSGTASGTRTRADPATLDRADDTPLRDPRPRTRRPRSDA